LAAGVLRRQIGRISATRRNGSRDGSGWRIECSQLSLKRKSLPQIETALLRGKGFFDKNVDPRRKTFSEYSLCNLLKDLNSQSAIAVDLPKKQFPHGPAHVLFFNHTVIIQKHSKRQITKPFAIKRLEISAKVRTVKILHAFMNRRA
jgi:hypothetical protein